MNRGIGLLAMGLLMLLGVASGCRDRDAGNRGHDVVRVVVSISALAELIRPALPEGSELAVLIRPGMSPHEFEPRASDLAALRRADLVIVNGLGVEIGLGSMLAATDHEGRSEIEFAEVAGITGAAGEPGVETGHADGGIDVHLWLDPELCVLLVRRVIEWSSGGEGEAEEDRLRQERGEGVIAQIRQMDASYRERLSEFAGRRVVTDHRAWDRLFARYGIEVIAVIRPIEHVEPSAGAIAGAIGAIREHGASAIFVEPQFAGGAAQRIADATGVPIGRLDPLGEDWFAMMRANLDQIVRTLEAGG